MSSLLPSNDLRQVVTYNQQAELAWMLNSFVVFEVANMQYQNFQTTTANLGDSVTFKLADRAYTQNGLVIDNQPIQQRFQTLSCTQAINRAIAFDEKQLTYNDINMYMRDYGRASAIEIGSKVEADVLKNINGEVRVGDPQNPLYGTLANTNSGPFRFYGDGQNGVINPINSSSQLAQALANFANFGAAQGDLCGLLPDTHIPGIINTNANQFTLDRNNREVDKWMVGNFAGCEWYRSNLLPLHVSGSVGNASGTGNVLTLVSVNDPTGANITELTFSGASASDVNAIRVGDRGQFVWGVSGQEDLYYRTFNGHEISEQPVQFRVIEDAASNGGGNVVVKISWPLVATPGPDQNLSTMLQPGMQAKFMPSYRTGLIMSGNPLYLAMPKMQSYEPYPSVATSDEKSGVSIRHYWGAIFGQNVRSYVWDQIWGSTLVQENCMAVLFPVRAS